MSEFYNHYGIVILKFRNLIRARRQPSKKDGECLKVLIILDKCSKNWRKQK